MAVEFGPTPLTERQTLLVILRATGPAGAAAGTGRGCCRAHPRARTGRAAPSRTALRSVGAAHRKQVERLAFPDEPHGMGNLTARPSMRGRERYLVGGIQTFLEVGECHWILLATRGCHPGIRPQPAICPFTNRTPSARSSAVCCAARCGVGVPSARTTRCHGRSWLSARIRPTRRADRSPARS